MAYTKNRLKKLFKNMILSIVHKSGYEIRSKRAELQLLESSFPPDFTPEEIEIIKSVKTYTMTGLEALSALIHAVKYVERNQVPGGIVECGVWKGGSMMTVAKTLLALKTTERQLYLFDTFAGMPRPAEVDVSAIGHGRALDSFAAARTGSNTSDWTYASLKDVQKAMNSTGYPQSKIHFVEGLVEETLPSKAPDAIAILRLDTDLYSSTRHELVNLYPRLSRGGVLIIDDYGVWQGAKKATDEYFEQNKIAILLQRIDFAGVRVAVKL